MTIVLANVKRQVAGVEPHVLIPARFASTQHHLADRRDGGRGLRADRRRLRANHCLRGGGLNGLKGRCTARRSSGRLPRAGDASSEVTSSWTIDGQRGLRGRPPTRNGFRPRTNVPLL